MFSYAKTVASGALVCAAILFFVAPIVCQPGGAMKLTQKEAAQAKALAIRFETKMKQVNGARTVIRDLFVRDLIQRYLDKEQYFTIPLVSYETAKGLNNSDLKDLVIALIDFEYLTKYYQLQTYALDRGGDPTMDDLYPPGVSANLRKAFGNKFDNPEFPRSVTISSTHDLVNVVKKLASSTNLMRNYLRMRYKSPSETYTRNLRLLAKSNRLREPSAILCNDRCFGFPANTRLILVNTSVYQLQLVNIGDDLKIVNLGSE